MTSEKDLLIFSDEIIDVKLPRKDYELLRKVLERETAYGWFRSKVRSFWVWTIASGLLALFALSDQIKEVFK